MLRVVVTGAAGALGRQLVARLLRGGYDALEASPEELGVLDRAGSRRAIGRLEPDVVVDCALSDADSGELVTSASNVATAVRAAGAYGLYLSRADVFAGDADDPYVESDTPRPTTARGQARLEAEAAVARGNPRHAIVRTSTLFGQGHGDAADVILSAASGAGHVAFDATTRVSPAYSVHLAGAAAALVRRRAYGVFHVPAGGSCTELQFARVLLRMTGSRATAVAREPGGPSQARNLVLASCRGVTPLPDWRIGLQAYVQARRRSAEEREGARS